jgi:hypothetical protein
MSGVYSIQIYLAVDSVLTLIFTGSFVVDYNQTPNVVAFYENGNPNNILAPPGSWAGFDLGVGIVSDNIFVSKKYPFTYLGTNITTMSYYAGNYGDNTTDNTYNFYTYNGDPFINTTVQSITNFPSGYQFSISGGPVTPPFPLDGSIPPASFYTIQGLPMYLNQNVQYKVYYSDIPQFPYLSVYADELFPEATTTYQLQNIPLPPFLSNMNQSQLLTYQQQLQLFRKVYEYNSNAYITYLSNPGTARGPIYYTFNTYKELNNYKAALKLVNRLYPFDQMADAYDILNGVPLNWIVPFPM